MTSPHIHGGWKPLIRRGVFVGSGSDAVSHPYIAELIFSLVGNAALQSPSSVTVTYIGAAVYDLDGPRQRQTGWFVERGCRVLNPQLGSPPRLQDIDVEFARTALREADVVVVSGGNTLYLIDRLRACGLVPELQAAAQRGAVMCGGSAGAILWFDAGHSDSLDPDTHRAKMLAASAPTDESLAPLDAPKPWRYVRLPCLGLLPGFCCPHHDVVQSNGVPRAEDFDSLLSPSERGIGIDHWAAIALCDGSYEVHAVPGKHGSVAHSPNASSAVYVPNQGGRPGVWIKEKRADGHISLTLAPRTGMIVDLLRESTAVIPEDPRLAVGRTENPIHITDSN